MSKLTKLDDWVAAYFGDRVPTVSLRKRVIASLRVAGFGAGVPPRNTVARYVADQVMAEADHRADEQVDNAAVRTAAVVTADGVCPRCGAPMIDVGLHAQRKGRFCQNPRCRVTAHVGIE